MAFVLWPEKSICFFIEANTGVIGLRTQLYDYYYQGGRSYAYPESRYGIIMKGVLGAGAGAKLLSRYGFFGELYTGLSRLIDNTGLGSFPYYSHTGLTLGKRF